MSADSGTGAVALGGTLSVTSADSAITVTADTNTLSIQLHDGRVAVHALKADPLPDKAES